MVEDTFGTIGRPCCEDIEYARGLERNLSDHDSEDSAANVWAKNHEAVFIALFEQQRITVISMLHILFGDSVMTNMLDFPVIPAPSGLSRSYGAQCFTLEYKPQVVNLRQD